MIAADGTSKKKRKRKGGDEFDAIGVTPYGPYGDPPLTDKDESMLFEPAGYVRKDAANTSHMPVAVPQKDDEDREVPKLSYAAVKAWQSKIHPRDPENDNAEYVWFSADLKYLPICLACIKKTEWITPEARAIGLGPVLFLHTMKVFAYLFFFFFLVNLPIIFFYSKGQGPASLERVSSGQFTDLFGRITFGNLGMSDFACSNYNMARNDDEFLFSCPYGTIRELF